MDHKSRFIIRLLFRSVAMALIFLGGVSAHGQQPIFDFDQGCSNPAITGIIKCNISQPPVKGRDIIYFPNVIFAPGDLVSVGAGGCVQTGGPGKTWKLYLNPSGPNSDRLYHGLIKIPTAKAGALTVGTQMTRLLDVTTVNKTQYLLVTGIGVPPSQLLLHLGYEDDGYSDNGYSNHDSGTEDQCQNVYDAYVKIVIYRGVAPPPLPGAFDFNLAWNSQDPQGLPLNPEWVWQTRPQNAGNVPDTALCSNFINNFFITACSNQTNSSNVDNPTGFNESVCSLEGNEFFHGHLNWFPVTYQGKISFGEHAIDDDYDLEFIRDGNPGSVNGRNKIHSEFDSEETVDNFHTNEWNAFHDAVDRRDGAETDLANCRSGHSVCTAAQITELQNEVAMPNTLFDGQTIVTGMFGVDCEHDCKSELHPIYAMATLRDNYESGPDDEAWLMFVRNIGDEGFCSSRLWSAGFTSYTFKLRWREGMTSVEVLARDFEGTIGTTGPIVGILLPPSPDKGIYVTFFLPSPSEHPLIDGALHLKWIGQPALERGKQSISTRKVILPPVTTTKSAITTTKPPVTTASTSAQSAISATQPPVAVRGGVIGVFTQSNKAEDIDEAEHLLQAAINQLPEGQKQQVLKARGAAILRPMHPLPSTGPARQISVPPAMPLLNFRANASAGNATEKDQRDAAQIRALCAATNNAPAGVPAGTCKQ